MEGLCLPFETRLLPGIDESFPAGLQRGDIPLHICRSKAAAYMPTLAADELLITADTIVWLQDESHDGEDGGTLLEKPASDDEARHMLARLSGRTHQVYTAVCLTTTTRQESFVCATDVTFATLTAAEIDFYVDHFHPLDKAGAYGVQEWIGYVGVEQMHGSFYNVMGLPIQRLYQALKLHFGIMPAAAPHGTSSLNDTNPTTTV